MLFLYNFFLSKTTKSSKPNHKILKMPASFCLFPKQSLAIQPKTFIKTGRTNQTSLNSTIFKIEKHFC
ncbi:hypothetical protein Hanom_Chr05g00443811 [Helianthus anomalus]